MFTYEQVFQDKQNILFVTAHPDDAVAFFGGLIHQLCLDGKQVSVLLATTGARGSREHVVAEAELAQQRLKEEHACLNTLGVQSKQIFQLEYKDGEMEANYKLIGEVSYYLRKLKVDLVATHEPSLQYAETYAKDGYFVQHRDHRKIGEAVIDAVYPFSRDRSFFPEHYQDGTEPHSVFDILLTDENQLNFQFDYTEKLEIKKQAMRAHASQFDEATITAITEAFKAGDRYVENSKYLKLLW